MSQEMYKSLADCGKGTLAVEDLVEVPLQLEAADGNLLQQAVPDFTSD